MTVPTLGLGPSLSLPPSPGFLNIDGDRGTLPSLSVEIDVTNAPTNPTRVWTDITADIRSLTYTRAGRNDELQRTQPGTLHAIFDNRTAKYDRTNGSGLGVKRSQWIRVRAYWNGTIYSRWQGIIETVDQSWPSSGKDAIVDIGAADAMKVTNLYDLMGQTFSSQRSDQRFTAIAALIGLTAVADDNGASTIVAASTAFGTGSLASSHLQQLEETENGLIFADADGQLRFQSRHYRLINSPTAVATIGENAGEIPYRIANMTDDDGYVFNVANITPTNSNGTTGTTQTAANASSKTADWTRAINRTILSSSTTEALSCAQYVVNRYGDPQPRVPSVELLGIRDTSKWPTILSIVNSQRFTFKRRATSHTISQDCYVEKITETVVPGTNWQTVLQLSPAIDQAAWVLGSSINGLLGQTTSVTY